MHIRRWFIMVLILTGLITVALPRSASAKEMCFAGKTEFCLNDPFTGYWEGNGGLPVFGYPITAAAPEQNRDTGQTYNTQWVERNRMEVHPENAGTPYEILLGLLGKDRLAQSGRNWQAEPRETKKDGCLWFEQTGHNVCNNQGNLGFKTYWETHGLKIPGLDNYARSLQLFGLPLTEPKMETNSSGDTVLTQWFERARFEWHPNESDEYKVLLGLLGKEVRSGTTPPQPTPTPTPPPPSFNNCQADPTVAPNYPLTIVTVDKSAEAVTLKNMTAETVNVDGWKICSIRGNQLHATLSGTFAPNEQRVIASQASGAIWSNGDKDDASLYNGAGSLISFWNDPNR